MEPLMVDMKAALKAAHLELLWVAELGEKRVAKRVEMLVVQKAVW